MIEHIVKLLSKKDKEQPNQIKTAPSIAFVREGLPALIRTYTHRTTLIKKEGERFVEALEKVGLPVKDDAEAAEIPFPERLGLKEMGESVLRREKALHAITKKVSGSYYLFSFQQKTNSEEDISWVKDNREFFRSFRDYFHNGTFQANKKIGFSAELDEQGDPFFGGHLLLSAQIILDKSNRKIKRRLRDYEPVFRKPFGYINTKLKLPLELRAVRCNIARSGYGRKVLMDPFGPYSHRENINYSEWWGTKMPKDLREEVIGQFGEFLYKTGKYRKALEEFIGGPVMAHCT